MSKEQKNLIPISMVRDAQDELSVALKTDPQYSLEVDPIGTLKLTPEQKRFIECYSEFPSIAYASQLAGIEEELGREIYFDPVCKQERRRINLAKNYRKFSRRLLTVDEIGGYLTSMLMDEDMGGERLSSKDKIQVTKQIIELNKLKAEAYMNPRLIENVEFSDADVKDLTAEDLKNLIEQTRKGKSATDGEKGALISELNKNGDFDTTDIENFWSLTVDELKQLLKESERLEHGDKNLSDEEKR